MAVVLSALTPRERIRKSIITMQESQPFFSHLAMGLRVIEMKREDMVRAGMPMQTAMVNGKGEMIYCAEWIGGLKPQEVTGVLAHEVMHIALDHIGRMGGRNRNIANIAMDIVVNDILERSKFELPEEGIIVKKGSVTLPWKSKKTGRDIVVSGVQNKYWEQIYDELLEHLDIAEEAKVEGGKGKGHDMHDHTEEGSPHEQEEERRKWQQRISEAAVLAKQQGKMPSGVDRFIDGLLKPRIRWTAKLRRFVRPYISPVDFTYQRPHKKATVTGVYQPSILREHTEIEVVVDTSGSIVKEELTEFLSESVGIAKSSAHTKMWVSFCDAQIQTRYVVANGNIAKILAMEPKGGGGTNMEAALDEIKKKNPGVSCVVVFTDGHDCYERTRKEYPFEVIWVLSRNGVSLERHKKECKYGLRVKMEAR